MQQPIQKPSTLVSLDRGQSQHAVLRRGNVISLASGAVLVICRTQLENSVLTVQVPLHAGGVYCVAAAGVYEIRALKDARLHQVPAQNGLPPHGLQAAFKLLASRLLSSAQGLLVPRPAQGLSRA